MVRVGKKDVKRKDLPRGRRILASFRGKLAKKAITEKIQGRYTKPRVVFPRKDAYWWAKRRIITIEFIVYYMYAEDYVNGNFSRVDTRNVRVVVYTSYSALPRILERLQPLVEQEIKIQDPSSVILGSVVSLIIIGKRTDERLVLPEKRGRRIFKRKLREAT